MVEIGRFIATALAVALAIPTFGALVWLFTGESFSLEVFFAIGAISFAMALVGGVIVGLPTLWLAKRTSWDRDVRKFTLFGCIMGTLGGIALSLAFFEGNLLIIMAGLMYWAAMGAIAGIVSTNVWWWLHADGRQQALND